MKTIGFIVVTIVLGIVRLWWKSVKKGRTNDKIMEEAPDADPDELADINERERMQDATNPRAKP